MARFETVVFATDFSTHADLAFVEAKCLAETAGAALSIVHVVPDTAETPGEAPVPDVECMNLMACYYSDGADYLLLHGHPAQEILRLAEGRKSPVIVIGSRGIGALSGLVGGGSMCDKIVANATCPVLVIPGPKRESRTAAARTKRW